MKTTVPLSCCENGLHGEDPGEHLKVAEKKRKKRGKTPVLRIMTVFTLIKVYQICCDPATLRKVMQDKKR